jgi:hypothetical protein
MLSQTAWDTSAILSDTSLFGRVRHTLIGYSDQPSMLQVVAYCATLAVIVVLTKTVGSRRVPAVKARGERARSLRFRLEVTGRAPGCKLVSISPREISRR